MRGGQKRPFSTICRWGGARKLKSVYLPIRRTLQRLYKRTRQLWGEPSTRPAREASAWPCRRFFKPPAAVLGFGFWAAQRPGFWVLGRAAARVLGFGLGRPRGREKLTVIPTRQTSEHAREIDPRAWMMNLVGCPLDSRPTTNRAHTLARALPSPLLLRAGATNL